MDPLFIRHPHFGWMSWTHQAIDQEAIRRLGRTKPDEPQMEKGKQAFQGFLQSNLSKVVGQDNLQDLAYYGPPHFTDLEDLQAQNHYLPQVKLDFKSVQKRFSPEVRARLRQKWKKIPLVEQLQLVQHSSSFQSALRFSQHVWKQLKAVKEDYPRLQGFLRHPWNNKPDKAGFQQATIEAYQEDLINNVGALAHYIGDLFSPFHTHRGHNWEQGIAGSNPTTQIRPGVHFFVECLEALQNPFDSKWDTLPQKKLLPPKNREDLPRFFADVLKESYLLNFDIVAIQNRALQEPKEKQRQFFAQEVEKRIIPHVRLAADALAQTLEVLWKEAGRPGDFSPLPSASDRYA